MPFGRCPVCGAGYHMSVGLPLDEWYRRYWPRVRIGDEVPGECPRCSFELRPGDRVTVRAVPAELEGRVGVGAAGVVSAVEAGGPFVAVVTLEGQSVPAGKFSRDQLFYVLGRAADA